MTPSDLAALEQRLIASCEKARAAGKRIVSGIWGVFFDGEKWVPGACCCPFGAVLASENLPNVGGKITALEKGLGISTGVIAGVMNGVDGTPVENFEGDLDAYQIGVRLRARFVLDGAL